MEWIEFKRRVMKYQEAARNRKDERFAVGDTDGTFQDYTSQEMLMDLLVRLEKIEAVLGTDKD